MPSALAAFDPDPDGADRFAVVIPARFAAQRLPGKPLRDLGGQPLIRYVWERACASRAGCVLIATDDVRVARVCEDFGAEVMLTADTHQSGTDRIAEVVDRVGWPGRTRVVNVQGDEPCMPAALIDQVAENLRAHADFGMATLATPLTDPRQIQDPNIVKTVTDRHGRALYFSRAPIPWRRDPVARASASDGLGYYRHIGIYAYRAGFLRRICAWPPAPLEQSESLEQLRVLWHGQSIHVGIARVPPGPGVDTPADVEAARAWLARAAGDVSGEDASDEF